jgi:hypothetical protein
VRPDLQELSDELAVRRVENILASFILEYAESHRVEMCTTERKDGLVPLGAAYDAYAAVFVGAGSLSIALDPEEAAGAHKRLALRMNQSTPATHHVIVCPEDLHDSARRDAIAGLLDAAFERSDRGPRWTRISPDRTIQRGGTCPKCFIEMPLQESARTAREAWLRAAPAGRHLGSLGLMP